MSEESKPTIETPSYQGPDRRNGVPVILDESWAKFMARMGMSGIAIFLIYQLTMGMQANVTNTAAMVQQHSEESKRNEDDFDRLLRTLLNVTVQQCVNAAATEGKRDACFQAAREGAVPIRAPR